MGVRVWTFITQDRGVCVRAWVKWMQHSDACASHYEATLFVLMHICSIQSFRVTEGSRRAHECIERVQRVKPNLPSGVCSYVHFNRGGAGTFFLSVKISHSVSLSCFRFLCSLSASSFSSHTFSLPPFSVMLPLHLSLPSHALFF